ncbi:hypothetical protein [Chryseobacterium sp. 2987]|uniref:hypothetical protein n=1 Tax=Chryseobacterium sp. 2987 TaxID=2817767 RepID=UPI00285EF955|nr:hypothetical protein [Chryseobacterium sp. 2987]MDR6922397.1 hypothetical protein [Chryseobacterium sp. 2987]
MKKTFILAAIAMAAFSNAQSTWNLLGNLGTSPGKEYIGTRDEQDLVIKTMSTERMRIHAKGSIGINTAPDPNYIFKAMGRSQFISTTTSDTFQVLNHGANVGNGSSLVWLSYKEYQPNNPGIFDVSGITSLNGPFESILSLKANGKMVLGPSSLTFNCSDCNDYRLFVKNGIRTEKIKVDIAADNGWADYVFEKDYKLMPLNELDKFISENGHLPEVPTTEEAIKNGVELKEMNILLLKKVEELTLYMIQQSKEIKELKNKVQQYEK